jgi:protease-4
MTRLRPALTGDAIGVVMAVGEIGDGVAAPGSIGGLSTSNLIRMAREDSSIKAIVLRVDSPGGSAFGSELIRRELELTRAAGKPVVVSMGNVAASGGYWIPTVDKALDKVGIHSGGAPTTWLGDAGDPTRPLDPRFAQVMQSSIDHVYGEFTRKAAQARKTTPEKIDAVAQGRVWTGAQAQERGLVDTLGSFGDALRAAARRGKLGTDTRVVYIERESSKFDKLIEFFGGSTAMASIDAMVDKAVAKQAKAMLAPTGIPLGVAGQVVGEINWLNEIAAQKKPFTVLTHCMCTPAE